jgi:hypothetical protein
VKLFYRARHAAEPSHPTRRRASTVVPLALAFALVLGSVALADELIADSDELTAGNQASIAFENVCQGVLPVTKGVNLWIEKTPGVGGGNRYTDGSSVSVTISTLPSHLSAATSVGTIGIPTGWESSSTPLTSVTSSVTSSVTLLATAPVGAYSQTINYLAREDPILSGQTPNKNRAVTVTANVLASTDTACAPPNRPPTAGAGGTYAGNEGAAIPLGGTASDPDGDPLNYSWSYVAVAGVDPGATCVFSDAGALSPTIACTDDGSYQLTLTVSDSLNAQASDTADLEVYNVDPSIDSVGFEESPASCGDDNATLSFEFSDPGANDTHTFSVDWGDGNVEALSGSPASHTYGAAGVYTALLTVTDDDGGYDSDTASITINYTIVDGGVLPPIKADGSSVFKFGSTVPVKVKIQDCDGSYPGNLVPQIKYQKMNGTTPSGDPTDPLSTSGADTTGVMRFTGAPDYQYIYNLATKSLPDSTATYRVVITIPGTGQVIYSANWGTK